MTVESAPDISVVVPVHDESGAAVPLAREIAEAFAGRSFEMIFVDDASRDATLAELQAVMPELPMLRVLAHGSNAGQSRAVRTGVLAARGAIIVTLDGDGQNPPIDAPRLVDALIAAPADVALIGGRRAKRQDSAAKRQASLWANRIRKRLLDDDADDTGCGLKAFRRDVFLRLPYFDHIHRYLPALVIREGYRNQYLDVGHRHRETGRSKYTNWGRLRASLSDLMGVIWLKSRSRRPGAVSEF
ncbi:dolichol-phosphate mannosyltransferase [Brevundimonas nasdae]|jgi:dolichol-phosphate mannosyltransferase|uniref:Glycosyltransferase family 2 protein n=1 Tax=Brevundimonas nasdae TaxID=172043 RepID=A0ABX8THA9_9CAUL|nr:glycosyltransferase family 2 protein [Brevundimonas nasdae]MBK6024784.1 glycosyltransferase family 2 protein [Brevundimonas nasdae]MDQ0451252.1 dolichol-phosphate mannosyltransferase [Brevundimonas nasdae]QYC09775.1 glycosyltransferase family 2 protein [Brevundimonas nasdae]QYC12563.1 glycosyltransferase family 2 protein [Brevundimonas nasdae]